MTLILDYLRQGLAISVSDRLVTKGGRAYERRFNKVLVCLLNDAVLTVSFTGLAYMRGIPTDDWLASLIVGPTYNQLAVASFRQRRGPITLASARSRIVVGLKNVLRAPDRALREQLLEVQLFGLRFDSGMYLPHALVIKKEANSLELRFSASINWRSSRRWNIAEPQGHLLHISGGWHKQHPQIGNDAILLLSNAARTTDDDSVIARILIDTLRKFAAVSRDGIGDEAMAVTHLPMSATSRVSFEPLVSHPTFPAVEGISGAPSVSYTPWIIGPYSNYAPALFTGPELSAHFSRRLRGGEPGSPYVIQIRGAGENNEIFYFGRAPRRR